MPSRLLLHLLLVLLLLAVGLSPVRGQRLEDGEVAFEKLLRQTRDLRPHLLSGKDVEGRTLVADPKEKRHVEALDIASKDVAWSIYWKSVGPRPSANLIAGIVTGFENRLASMAKNRDKGLGPAELLYVKGVIQYSPEVVQKGKPIASINAARLLAVIPERRMLQSDKAWLTEVLPRLADGNAQQLGNACVDLLGEARLSDGARYYLLRGMAHLLTVPPQTPPLLKKETEEKAVLAALKTIEQKVTFPRATPREEIEGYKALRREAVRLVAQTRTPALGKERPAFALARIAGNDESVSPAPRLDERIEAALGLCRLTTTAAKFPDFQVDNAAFQVAHTVNDFVRAANENIESKAAMKQRPWKVDAARLQEGLDQLRPHKSPYVAEVVKRCTDVLTPIEAGRKSNAVAALTDWLGQETNQEKDRPLFKGVAATVVKRAGADD